MNRLAGKAALVTGGGSGIGAATGALFCSQGAAVMLVDSNEAALAKTAALIREQLADPHLSTFVADVADAAAAVRAVERTVELFGHLNVLVNNAAMRSYSAITETEPTEWHAVA